MSHAITCIYKRFVVKNSGILVWPLKFNLSNENDNPACKKIGSMLQNTIGVVVRLVTVSQET